MSPFEMRSMYSADMFKGLMTLSSVRLKPSRTFLKSPWCLAASARTASLPSNIDWVSATPSPTSRLRASMQTFSHILPPPRIFRGTGGLYSKPHRLISREGGESDQEKGRNGDKTREHQC